MKNKVAEGYLVKILIADSSILRLSRVICNNCIKNIWRCTCSIKKENRRIGMYRICG